MGICPSCSGGFRELGSGAGSAGRLGPGGLGSRRRRRTAAASSRSRRVARMAAGSCLLVGLRRVADPSKEAVYQTGPPCDCDDSDPRGLSIACDSINGAVTRIAGTRDNDVSPHSRRPSSAAAGKARPQCTSRSRPDWPGPRCCSAWPVGSPAAGSIRGPASWEYISPVILQPSCATSSCHSRAAAVAGLDFSNPERGYISLTRLKVWVVDPTRHRRLHALERDHRGLPAGFPAARHALQRRAVAPGQHAASPRRRADAARSAAARGGHPAHREVDPQRGLLPGGGARRGGRGRRAHGRRW